MVATDNAGNETTATVRTYRRHHEHSYSDWSKDGTSHWHECTDYDCPNRNKSIKDKAAHDYTDDADTICNVCGYERTVTPPAPAEYTITVTSGGNGTASTSHAKAVAGTEITLTATPNTGYHFKEWEVMSGGVTIKDDKFLMPGSNVEVKAIFEDMSKEQFTLAPGGTYYFDLSGESIPGTANDALPDSTMHYVPFTYAGTVDAYKLTSEMATTEEYAQQNEYAHSLFVADYAVTHAVSWDKLHAEGLIFGKGYAAGSVEYTMRAPSGEVPLQAIIHSARPKATNGTGYWTRTADISKTGERWSPGDKILHPIRYRTVWFAGTIRPVNLPTPILRLTSRTSVSAPSWKS
ncbi:MAG: InlB B-repeat-containing protein [Oscillospiraceae bacterium]